MERINLLDITVRKLLKKFGKGNHEPGSGSAAAFHGLLSSHLLVTVVSITLEPDKIKYYREIEKQLNSYKKTLENNIIPRLEELFEEDSIQFDKVIKFRGLRDYASDSTEKHYHEKRHLKQLKLVTEIPIEIAGLCIDISKIADFVFSNGFQSARGDTCVAQSNSLAAIQGCISIIDLNLLSFIADAWTDKKHAEVDFLTKSYIEQNKVMQDNFSSLQQERKKRHLLQAKVYSLLEKIKGKKSYEDHEIEGFTSKLQNLVWINRKYLWRKEINSPLDILKPNIVFKKVLGYQYCDLYQIENNQGTNSWIAGVIDQPNKVIYVSKSTNFSKEEQNFTAAHELGHAILHKQPVIHRDKPSDGSIITKSPVESQADKLATYFLMPRKQVIKVFNEWFGTTKFIVNEDNCYRHFNIGPSELREHTKTLRGLSLKLSSHEKQHNGRYGSIADLFKVSRGTFRSKAI